MKYFLNILFFLFSANCFCQVLTNNGATLTIMPSTIVNTNILENLSGTIANSGTLTLKYSYHNLATIKGNGNYNIGGNLTNNGTFTPGTGVVTFNGSTAQDIFSSSSFNNITINKSSGSAILLTNLTINGTLNFISGNIQTGNNKVVISATGSVTGGSQSTGWVNGNLQKNIQPGATSQMYEVGDNVNYTPAALGFNGVTTGGTLTTDAIATDHPNISTSGIDMNKSVNRYFTFTNNGIVFTDASLTLNWKAGDVDAGAITANFKAAKYNGTTWTFPTTGTITSTSIQVNGITSFGDFAVGEILSVLPVKLSSVRAYSKNKGIQVDWITQFENNMDRYEVERSANGQQFIKVGLVQSKGNSNVVVNYGWFDANPLNGINYYRIKSVEKTGQTSYSQIVKVNITTGAQEIIFYPNPVIGNTIQLQLNNVSQGSYALTLTNMVGQQIFKKLVIHNGGTAIQSIEINNLPAGLYQLNLSGGSIKFTKQVIKN